MKKVMIIALILLIAFAVPASATEIINESLIDFTDTSMVGELNSATSYDRNNKVLTGFTVLDVSLFDEISYFTLEVYGNQGYWPSGELIPEGRHETTYTYNGETKPAVIYVSRSTNWDGSIISTKYIFFPQDWDRQGLAGLQTINTPLHLVYARGGSYGDHYDAVSKASTITNLWLCNSDGEPCGVYLVGGHNFAPRISHATAISWVNNLLVTTTDEEAKGYTVDLIRTVNGITAHSTLEIYQNTSIIYRNAGLEDITLWYPQNDINKINVTSPVRTWSYNLNLETPDDPDDPDDPDVASVAVYIKNSQTGALLAGSHINISASVNGNLHEVINETIPGGIATYTLQPTGGGMPNPDYYRLITSLEGYNSIMPYIDFELGSATTLFVEMEPTTGGPVDDNMTFIEFYVRDIYANPISGASVTCGGYTLITNSAGYTQFEMPINGAYSYNVSKTGYLTIEGIARVESDDRYVVNVALMAGVVPTHTVVTPTITVEPTQTTPPIQEDNIIGLSVKGLAKGFGIDYDTALLLFGLMIVFGAGGIVMSSVKGGAMEFIAGSIVGTFVAFALGLIPIWIFIIIAVVFGAYVLRVFVQGGQ